MGLIDANRVRAQILERVHPAKTISDADPMAAAVMAGENRGLFFALQILSRVATEDAFPEECAQ